MDGSWDYLIAQCLNLVQTASTPHALYDEMRLALVNPSATEWSASTVATSKDFVAGRGLAAELVRMFL